MYYSQNDLAGFKRQPLPIKIFQQFDDTHKKVKTEESINVKLEEDIETTIQEPLSPQIPPLLNNSGYINNNNDTNWGTLKPFLLLNHARMVRQYFQLLKLRNFVEKQKDLLSTKRDTSASSYDSYSTSNTLFSNKAPSTFSKNGMSIAMEIPKLDEYFEDAKIPKVSACKNYIALLCTGFARSILTAPADSETRIHLHKTVYEKKAKYISLAQRTQDDLYQFMLEHIHRDICGKRVKKTDKGRDFKIRNSDELAELLFPQDGESDLLKFRKEVVKEMLDYFFRSGNYSEWLEKGMMSEANKEFFLKNKVEIKKKFSNPVIYRPHFDYN